MQSEEILNEMVGKAKDHPFKVRLEFDYRFRVWRDIIHRNRRLHLYTATTPEELRSLIGRYKALDIADAERLQKRAFKEFEYVSTDNNTYAVLAHYQILKYRSKEIEKQLEYQLMRYELTAQDRIRLHDTVVAQEQLQIDGGI